MAGGRATGVVGLGASGIAVLAELVAAARPPAEVVVFNPAGSLGRGVPYAHAAAGGLLLNRPVTTMDLATDPTGAFAAWADRNGYTVAGAPREGRDARDDLFLERGVFGHYLLDELAAVLARARRAGVVVTIVADVVVDAERHGEGGYVVRTAGGEAVRVAELVLATGHRPPADPYGVNGHPRCAPAPAPGRPGGIDPAADVVVLGTRLSAVETALALLRDGHRGRVALVSRGGRLPAVRGRNGPWAPSAFTAGTVVARARSAPAGDGLTLRTVRGLLAAELARAGARVEDIGLTARAGPVAQLRADVAAALAGPLAWQEVLAASNVAVSTAWHHLDRAERLRFLARHHSAWLSRRVPVPAQTGAELLAALDGGALEVAGGVRRVVPEGAGFAVDRAGGRPLRAGWVVNATGGDARLHDGEPGLLGALLRRGLVVAHPLGGMRVDFATCRALDQAGRPAERIHALGALTHGTYYMTSAVDVIALQARRAVAGLRRTGRFTREAESDDHGVGAVQGRAAEPT